MERSLIKQVNKKNMAARLNTRHVKPVYFPNFFGVKKKTSLKWETLAGEKGAPVIADVISFDASAPQKTREVVSKISGAGGINFSNLAKILLTCLGIYITSAICSYISGICKAAG